MSESSGEIDFYDFEEQIDTESSREKDFDDLEEQIDFYDFEEQIDNESSRAIDFDDLEEQIDFYDFEEQIDTESSREFDFDDLEEQIDFYDLEEQIDTESSREIDFDDLEEQSLIGEGDGGSKIYRVVHHPTGNLYALKQLGKSLLFKSSSKQQILREIVILKRLDHPKLIKFYNLFDQGENFLLLLEYFNCKSLEGIQITDESSLSAIAGQVLYSLSYLHLKQLQHGNIRPSTILINSPEDIKISFLGQIFSSHSGSMTAYTSPELLNSSLNTGMCDGFSGDVWSLGISILELYLGSFPYKCGKEADWRSLEMIICHGQPPNAPPTASREFADFISCCLQKDQGKRCTVERLLVHPFISRSKIGWWKIEEELEKLEVAQEEQEKLEVTQEELDKLIAAHEAVFMSRMSLDEFDQWRIKQMGKTIKAKGSPVEPCETESQDKRTNSTKGNKVSPKLSPNADSEFENLPLHVRRCLTYSTLFPLDYEFEKDTLVQLWIAEELIDVKELIDAKANGKMEEEFSSICFDILVENEYFVPSSFDKLYRQQKYKINKSMSSLWYFRQGLPEESYVRIEEKKLEVISGKSLHLSLQKLDSTEFEAIRNCKQLRTLLLLGEYGSSIKELPFDIFQCLKSLRTLDLSRSLISRLPTSVGCLESLHYLDLSYTPIRSLPRSMERLHSLQTLKLRDCFSLCALPQGMRKLTNLRHLDFDIVRQLNSMPKGMGSLTNLQTLKAFLVGREDGCSIAELKDLDNLTGSFCISKLENVVNKTEAKEAALNKKQYIKKLELRWGDLSNSNSDAVDEILEYLQPHPNLEELQILFYNGSSLPSWIGYPSFTNIIRITFYNCKYCYLLPSMGELPSLRILKIVGMSRLRDINSLFCRSNRSPGLKAFPKLEKLTLENMLSLEEWTGIENGDFPCLLQMIITCCPKLYDLPLLSHFKALKNLEISHCTALQSLPGEHQLLALLESLIIRDCPKVKERCCKDGGEDWLKIAHVPNIWIDDEEISLT